MRNSSLCKVARVAAACVAVVVMAACSSDSDDSNSPASQPLIIGTGNGNPAGDATTDAIKENAVAGASRSLSVNLNRFRQLDDDNDIVDGGGMQGDADSLENDNNDFLFVALGVDDLGATTTREGDIITIDPDDNSLCADGEPLYGLVTNPANCPQLAARFTVQIDARTEDTGIISYLFDQMPLVRIGYSPVAASYELNMGTVTSFANYAQQLDGIETNPDASITGVLKLTAQVVEDGDRAEAADFRFEVTEALRVGPVASPSVSLQPSTVFAVTSNADTGETAVSVDWGALSIISESGDDTGATRSNRLTLGGLTAALNLDQNGETVSLSNVGFGGAPLSLQVNSMEVIRVGFNTIGLSVDNDTGAVVVDGDLGVSMVVDNALGALEGTSPGLSAMIGIAAPSGTSFVDQANGSTLVRTGGPLTSSVNIVDENQTITGGTSIEAGTCFGEDEFGDGSEPFIMVPCN